MCCKWKLIENMNKALEYFCIFCALLFMIFFGYKVQYNTSRVNIESKNSIIVINETVINSNNINMDTSKSVNINVANSSVKIKLNNDSDTKIKVVSNNKVKLLQFNEKNYFYDNSNLILISQEDLNKCVRKSVFTKNELEELKKIDGKEENSFDC